MDASDLTLKEAHEQLIARKLSAVELTKAFFARIKKVEPKIHSYVLLTEEAALAQAEAAQARLDKEEGVNPLLGIPGAHKDVFCTRGTETTACSNILKDYVPPYNSTVVDKLAERGAICLGKLNCDAFAHGSSTENSDFGPTHNPYDTDYVPGGSSGGSAAAVASGEAFFATGTDTGGSIRHPAGFTNVVGLKPTYGRVSRFGVIAMASSTDSPGPIARTVEDCALVLEAMAGHDRMDSTSSKRGVPEYSKDLKQDIKGWRIGVPNEFFSSGIDPDVEKLTRAAILKFEELGARVEGVSLPRLQYSLAAYYILMSSEVSSNLARYDGIKYGYSVERSKTSIRDLEEVYRLSRGRGFGAEAKRRVMLGTYALSAGYAEAFYKKAQRVAALIRQDFEKAFASHDLLLGPVSPTPPFRLGEKVDDPLAMYLSDIYTTPVNISGNPGLSVPCGFVGKLPVGLQIVGPHFAEDKILTAAYAFEQATGYYKKRPRL